MVKITLKEKDGSNLHEDVVELPAGLGYEDPQYDIQEELEKAEEAEKQALIDFERRYGSFEA